MDDDILKDKERAYFSQNYTPLRLQCPVCIEEGKYIKHCKIYKSFYRLWCHIKKEHNNVANKKFNLKQLKLVLNYVSIAVNWGIIPPTNNHHTTTSSLKSKSKGIRIDVKENLERIAELLIIQSELYPNFKIYMLEKMIKLVIGERDKRTVKKYLKEIINFSEKDKVKGIIDVTKFCTKFRNEK